MSYTFTPPTEDTVSNVAFDVPPVWNSLMRYYPTRKRGKAVWQLEDGSYTFDQPYPSVEHNAVNRDTLFPAVPNPPSGLGTSTSNLIALTYLKVFLGGHSFVVTDAEEVGIAAFLTAQGYTPSDWLVHI